MSSEPDGRGRVAVRAPLQDRSRASWERILEAGTALLEEEGFEALTITAVCKKARVSAPTIYARVDGLGGLFWAIYERGMVKVSQVQNDNLSQAGETTPDSPERVAAVIEAACLTFEGEQRFLRPIIRFASSNGALLARGAALSQDLVDQMTALLSDTDASAANAVARMAYSECVFRLMYGDHFLGHAPETFDAFRERLIQLALARLGQVSR